jgi:hypothetical protein
MALILGIDAAWTEHGSSALALLRVEKGGRKVIAVAPPYAGFIGLARRAPAEWRHAPNGIPIVPDLLAAATVLGGGPIDVVAMDLSM